MSREIQLAASVRFSKSGSIIETVLASMYVDVSGLGGIKSKVTIGTTDETLDLGDITTPGYLVIKNLDSTNYVSWGPDGTVYPNKAKAGEFAVVRWNGAAIHIKANTASCEVEYTLLPD